MEKGEENGVGLKSEIPPRGRPVVGWRGEIFINHVSKESERYADKEYAIPCEHDGQDYRNKRYEDYVTPKSSFSGFPSGRHVFYFHGY